MMNRIRIIGICALLFLSIPIGTNLFAADPAPPTITDAVKGKLAHFAPQGPKYEINFPINVWGGWAPLIVANGGLKTQRGSIIDKKNISLNLEIVESSQDLLENYITGKSPFMWGTVDLAVLMASEIERTGLTDKKDFEIYQQIDWSNGGDGIIVRKRIKNAGDLKPTTEGGSLKKKKIVLALFSPSHYYLLTILQAQGIEAADVELVPATDAFNAADIFEKDESIDACVSFAPVIYSIPAKSPEKFKTLTTTQDAKRLLADVWMVEKKYARENEGTVIKLITAFFEGMDLVNEDRDAAAKLIQGIFPAVGNLDDIKSFMNDAHLTNYAENKEFFFNDKTTGIDETWNAAAQVWQKAGVIKQIPVSRKQERILRDNTSLPTLFSHHKNEYVTMFEKKAEAKAGFEDDSIVTMVVEFDAATAKITTEGEKGEETKSKLMRIAQLSSKFGGAYVVISGYADPVGSDGKGLQLYNDLKVTQDNIAERATIINALNTQLEYFSKERTESVADALSKEYGIPIEQLILNPKGGEDPVTKDPKQASKNRRVEATVLRPENE